MPLFDMGNTSFGNKLVGLGYRHLNTEESSPGFSPCNLLNAHQLIYIVTKVQL